MFGAEEVLLDRATSAERRRRTRSTWSTTSAPTSAGTTSRSTRTRRRATRRAASRRWRKSRWAACRRAATRRWRRCWRYGEAAPVGLGGIGLLNAPGNDGVSSTAMVAAGAHILLFTTGRGTPLGFPSPTIKICTNSDLAREEAELDRLRRRPDRARHQHVRRARAEAVRAGARRRERAHADQERAQRLPRDRDLEGRRHAVSVAPATGRLPKLGAALLASGTTFPLELAVPPQRTRRCPRRCCSSARGTSCARSSTGCSRA